jgi:rhomboid protease GluP
LGTTDPTERDSFAAYLAKELVAKKGFETGTVPEAMELTQHSDFVVTYRDGTIIRIVCIVDRERHPDKFFDLSRPALDEIAARCRPYSGYIKFTRMPVRIEILEVGGNVGGFLDRDRLTQLKCGSMSLQLSYWLVNTQTKEVRTNLLWNRWLVGRRFIEKLMKVPRETDAEMVAPVGATPLKSGPPLVTYLVVAIFLWAFVGEYLVNVDPLGRLLGPSVRTLVALGGVDRVRVMQGDWYRLLSAAFLHANPIHLLSNVVAFFIAGSFLEGMIGRAWLLAVFILSAIAGTVGSVFLNEPNIISVGASGGIMGLFTAGIVFANRLSAAAKLKIQVSLGQVLAASLIPMATKGGVDYASHLGGAIGGGIVSGLLYLEWPKESSVLQWRLAAYAIICAGVGTLGAAAWALVPLHHDYVLVGQLIPRDKEAGTNGQGAERWEEFAKYPRDPRSHLYRGMAMLRANNFVEAEKAFEQGLKEKEILSKFFQASLTATLQTELAIALTKQGRTGEAKQVVRPLCDDPSARANSRFIELLCR